MGAATVLYGLTFPLTALILKDMGPLYLSAVRSLWSFIFFALYFLIRGYPRDPSYPILLGITIFGLVLPLIFQNIGMLYTTASLASIIQSTSPVFVVFLAFFFLKERLTITKTIGALIGILGTVIVMSQGAYGDSTFLGNVLIAGSSLSLAILAVMEKSALSKHSPIEILGITSMMGFPILLMVALSLESIPAFTVSSLGLTIVIALGCTVLPYFLWLDGLKDLEVSKAIVFSYGIPVFGMIFSVLLLGEMITLRMLCGMAVIFLSIWMAQK
jgi:drug/metabolite transporter (DMT)-like permease